MLLLVTAIVTLISLAHIDTPDENRKQWLSSSSILVLHIRMIRWFESEADGNELSFILKRQTSSMIKKMTMALMWLLLFLSFFLSFYSNLVILLHPKSNCSNSNSFTHVYAGVCWFDTVMWEDLLLCTTLLHLTERVRTSRFYPIAIELKYKQNFLAKFNWMLFPKDWW